MPRLSYLPCQGFREPWCLIILLRGVRLKTWSISALLYSLLIGSSLLLVAAPPAVGTKAPEFSLNSIRGKLVSLSHVKGEGQLVLIVLRGYPGYQCPLCNRQVDDFLKNATAFAQAGARVVMVYPGPQTVVVEKAQQFLADKQLPAHFDLLLDPDYTFTRLYDLRWDATGETAYPSTFLINHQGTIVHSTISNSHGGRTKAAEVLDVLRKLEGKTPR